MQRQERRIAQSTGTSGWLALVLSLLAGACSDSPAGPSPAQRANLIVAVSGDGQAAEPGNALAAPLVARVLDPSNAPVAGATVIWAVTAGSGTLSQTTTQTNSAGESSIEWTLGTAAGEQRVRASAADAGDVTFTARAGHPGVVASIRITAATNLLQVDDSVLLAAELRDAADGLVAGRTVTWISSDSTVAQVTPSGLVRSREAGTAVIMAAVDHVVATWSVTIHTPPFTSISAGKAQTCALSADGRAWCWGQNTYGQLGNGDNTTTHLPRRVRAPESLVFVQAADSFACGLGVSGTAYCWGANLAGRLGDGTTTQRNVPVAVQSPVPFVQVSAGYRHACGLDGTGQAFCWGSNGSGEFGTQSMASSPLPVPVSTTLRFHEVHAGLLTTCGRATDGLSYCWGTPGLGTLGIGFVVGIRPPGAPVGGGMIFTRLWSGGPTNCATTAGGEAFCWGHNRSKQVGNPEPANDHYIPMRAAAGVELATIAPSRSSYSLSQVCGLTAGGHAYCWGSNSDGQLGTTMTPGTCAPLSVRIPRYECSSEPLPVETPLRFSDIAAGERHSCAVSLNGRAYCWGRNTDGQLGIPDRGVYILPRRVHGQRPD